MNRNLILPIILLVALIGFGLYLANKYLCGARAAVTPAKIGAATTPIKAPAKMLSTLAIADGANFTTDCPRGFDFLNSSAKFLNLPTGVQECLKATAEYLKAHPDRQLTITGLYARNEKNTGVLDNLGLARANNVKNYLATLGIPSTQFELASKLIDPKYTKLDTIFGGASFGFGGANNNSDRISQIKARLFGKPLTLYFGTNQSEISLTAQQRKDFTDLIYYLDHVKSSKLGVVGHTDNKGDERYNVRLSRKRAEFVKDYLAKNGIIANKMKVSGKGPKAPVATNDTPEGRAKNRRVEVTLR